MSAQAKPGDVATAIFNGQIRLLRYNPERGLPWVMDQGYDETLRCQSNWHAADPRLTHFTRISPPKPEEPMDLGAVILDHNRKPWVRAYQGVGRGPAWYRDMPEDHDEQWRFYADIDVREVKSAGWSE